MKKLKFIPFTLLYVIYYFFTAEERHKYDYSKARGRECLGFKQDLFGTTYTVGKSITKEQLELNRGFLNFKEFRKVHNF